MNQSLFRRAAQIYRDEGLPELAKRVSERFFIDPVFYDPIIEYLSNESLSNEELLTYSKKNGDIYKWKSTLPNIDVSTPVSNGIDCSQRTTCIIPNGEIVGNRGLVLTEKNKPILQSIKHLNYYITPSIKTAPVSTKVNLFVSVFFNNDILKLKGGKSNQKAINMVMHIPGGHHYGHWLVEYLPKLYHLHQYETQTNTKPSIIINNNPPQWMIDSIVSLGYSKKRIINFDYTRFEVQELLVPLSSLSENKIEDISFSPIELQWLRRRYRRLINDHTGPNRIYVSRQELRHRKVTNYNELKKFLVDNGFEIVKPEELKFTEQVRAFSNADVIIGGYGSGLHNMLYAEDATIIEFIPPRYTSYLNNALACSLGHKYSSVDGMLEGSDLEDENIGEFGKNFNYQVPIKEVKNVLENNISDFT